MLIELRKSFIKKPDTHFDTYCIKIGVRFWSRRRNEPAALSATPPPCGSRNFFVPWSGTEISTAAPFRPPFVRHRRRSGSMPKADLLCSQIKKQQPFGHCCLFGRGAETNLRPSRLRRHLAVPEISSCLGAAQKFRPLRHFALPLSATGGGRAQCPKQICFARK